MGKAKRIDFTYARENLSCRAEVYKSHIFATGTFKLVYKGAYTEGNRKNQDCVCKYFKTGSVFEESYFDNEIKVVTKALELITKFNNAGIISSDIYLNWPTVWWHDHTGETCLVEPLIKNFEKYNSNTGWNPSYEDSTPWTDVMQALSHYSYHCTSGQLLLCDLQGGTYKKGYVLTDPVIISRTRSYGPSDLGPDGFSTFFSQHQCNKYCSDNWTLPRIRHAFHRVRQGSTMELPTWESRDSLSRQRGRLDSIYE